MHKGVLRLMNNGFDFSLFFYVFWVQIYISKYSYQGCPYDVTEGLGKVAEGGIVWVRQEVGVPAGGDVYGL